MVESVAETFSGNLGPGGTDSEALYGCFLNVWEDSKRLHTSVETYFGWLAKGSLPWAAYCAFMFSCLIALDKRPGVCPIGVRETWTYLFAKYV